MSARVTGFYNVLDGAIANITLSSTPAQITRQRANSDEIRAFGAEFEADVRLTSTLTITGQLALTSSTFQGSVATPAIEDNTVPQVPGWSGAVGLVWADPRVATVNLQVRGTDDAWDDDLNTLVLASYGVVDVFAGRTVWKALQAFVAGGEHLRHRLRDGGDAGAIGRLAAHVPRGRSRVLPLARS